MLIAARFSGSGSGKDLLSRTADETEVRRQIEEIERPHGGIGETPTEGFWRALWKIHSACGLDVPRFPKDAAAAARRPRLFCGVRPQVRARRSGGLPGRRLSPQQATDFTARWRRSANRVVKRPSPKGTATARLRRKRLFPGTQSNERVRPSAVVRFRSQERRPMPLSCRLGRAPR